MRFHSMNIPIKTPPETGFLRLSHIIGDKKREIPALVPVCSSAWWRGVRLGLYPAPIKLSPKVTVWRASDIRDLIENGPASGAEFCKLDMQKQREKTRLRKADGGEALRIAGGGGEAP
jgi:predicted DNA-binding transcriptional regulator AlpA